MLKRFSFQLKILFETQATAGRPAVVESKADLNDTLVKTALSLVRELILCDVSMRGSKRDSAHIRRELSECVPRLEVGSNFRKLGSSPLQQIFPTLVQAFYFEHSAELKRAYPCNTGTCPNIRGSCVRWSTDQKLPTTVHFCYNAILFVQISRRYSKFLGKKHQVTNSRIWMGKTF